MQWIMKKVLLLLSIAGMAVTSLYFYRSLRAVKDFNGAIHCCLLGILAAIFLLSIMMNYNIISNYSKQISIFMRKRKK